MAERAESGVSYTEGRCTYREKDGSDKEETARGRGREGRGLERKRKAEKNKGLCV